MNVNLVDSFQLPHYEAVLPVKQAFRTAICCIFATFVKLRIPSLGSVILVCLKIQLYENFYEVFSCFDADAALFAAHV